MAMNEMSINQIYQLVNAICNDVKGGTLTAPVNTAGFVAQATTALKTGYDPVINSISQIMHKTIFSDRAYRPIFAGIRKNAEQWGNHVRKLTPLDNVFESNDSYSLTDGQAVDQYVINKPKTLQTNFYGETTYQKHLTIFGRQLDTAFQDAGELGRFFSMVMTNAQSQIAQAREELERETVAGFIAAKASADSGNVIDLVATYNTDTGSELTAETVMLPANFPDFARWLFAYIKTLAMDMRVRGYRYHMNLTGLQSPIYIPRHTPSSRLKMVMYAPFINNVDARVLSTTFNDEYLRLIEKSEVTFWQTPSAPADISAIPSYTGTSGTVVTAESAVSVSNVIAVLYDEEAMGHTIVHELSRPSPYNARGDYYNQFWKWTDRYWNDITENAVVLTLGGETESEGGEGGEG